MPVFIKNIMTVFGAHSALIARNKKLPANEKISFGFRQPAQKFVQSRQSPRGALRGRRRQKNARAAPAGQTDAGRTSSRFRRTLPKRGNFAALPRACAFRSLQIALRLPRVRAPFRPARPRPKRCRARRVPEARRTGRNRATKKIFFIKKPRQNNFAGKLKNLTVNKKTFRFNSRA